MKIHPNVKIDISAGGAGKGMTDALSGMVDIGMVSREVYPEEIKKGANPVAVAKDAVVPVISGNNPALNDILAKGLKKDVANDIWGTGKYKTWAQAFGVRSKSPLYANAFPYSVQRLIITEPFSMFDAPVIYGMPSPFALYLSGAISCPDCNSIIEENRTHSQLSGISNGTSSAMHTGSFLPIFS